MIDVNHQINAVSRTIGTRTLAAGEARVLTLSQSYDTDLDDLWDACTNIDRLPRWFLPITGELKPGGRYQFDGNAGGVIERCDPPTSFAVTWEMGGEVSWVEVRLSTDPDGRSRFALEHVAHVQDEMWAQFGPGAVGIGWDGMLAGLALHLSGESMSTDEAQAWQVSAEGRQFTLVSSEKWAEANIAAGTPEQAARASQEAVSKFYLGE
ncbi:polyketide cyclase [Actinosynnema sp. ALI-1.44]|uniref:SRPBCC family protein n=1 Tax=Actinosynnema sp. ALI-1.44 TaxID=1933779 RepID=UPI00097C886F|nr:SRPBCC family protein [Actinosynnema sp. ALI-1.44]ONI79868.1 polyketide cyclase [Actinosynnema sp. ALI-1.44]